MLAYYEEQLVTSKAEFSLDDLYRAVERSRATVYTVVPGIKLLGLPPESQVAKVTDERRRQFVEFLKKMRPETQDKMKEMRAKRDEDVEAISIAWQAQRTEKLQSALAGVAGLTGGWTEFLSIRFMAGDRISLPVLSPKVSFHSHRALARCPFEYRGA